MTNKENKEKLEIINKKLDELYKLLRDEPVFVENTQSIYNLESTKLLLEPLPNLPTIYQCSFCGKRISCFGEFEKGECLDCGARFIKVEN